MATSFLNFCYTSLKCHPFCLVNTKFHIFVVAMSTHDNSCMCVVAMVPTQQVTSREDLFSYLHQTVLPLMSKMSETGERNLSIASEFFLVGGYRLRQARISKGRLI